jgi:hypothetical protein
MVQVPSCWQILLYLILPGSGDLGSNLDLGVPISYVGATML